MNLHLTDAAVIVSGGASGIGLAATRLFVEEGARVAVADRDPAALKCAQHMLPSETTHFIHVDLASETDCQRVVHETLARFGQINVLVNNAGVNDAISLDRSPSEFRASLDRNLLPAFALTHFAAPALRASHGSIVNISSKVATTGQGSTSGYAAAKGAINALTREWAVALAADGVRVNCVVPAECDTAQYDRWFQAQADPAKARSEIERLVPLDRRLTTPEEVAAMILFLASKHSAHTTGQIIYVDGGYTHLDRAVTADASRWSGG